MKIKETLCLVNKCRCGKSLIIKDFIQIKEIESVEDIKSVHNRDYVRLALCDCGTLFFRSYEHND